MAGDDVHFGHFEGGRIPKRGFPARPIAERFWEKVDKAGSIPEYRPELGPCWNWVGNKTAGGYGQFVIRHGKLVYAHRYAYEALRGPIPATLQIDHLCRVRACVNPWHMEPVTNRENMLRGEAPTAKTWRSNACRRGHAFDEQNTVRYQGTRHCRTCIRLGAKRRAEARQAVRP